MSKRTLISTFAIHRLEVERLKWVEPDLAAAQGAATAAREEAAQLRGQAVYVVASETALLMTTSQTCTGAMNAPEIRAFQSYRAMAAGPLSPVTPVTLGFLGVDHPRGIIVRIQ
jgi:hypothetical protein